MALRRWYDEAKPLAGAPGAAGLTVQRSTWRQVAGDFAAASAQLLPAARAAKIDDPLFAHLLTWAAEASLESGDCATAQTLAKRVTEAGSRFPIVHEARFVVARAELACADKPAAVAAAASAPSSVW